jgi:hypothetical protein
MVDGDTVWVRSSEGVRAYRVPGDGKRLERLEEVPAMPEAGGDYAMQGLGLREGFVRVNAEGEVVARQPLAAEADVFNASARNFGAVYRRGLIATAAGDTVRLYPLSLVAEKLGFSLPEREGATRDKALVRDSDPYGDEDEGPALMGNPQGDGDSGQ